MPLSIVTGSNTGLGLATAEGLARAGHHVVLAVRNTAKGDAAAQQIRAAVPDADLSVMRLDLASLASVRDFAADVTHRFPAVDVLINNAGIVQKSRTTTADGFETTFGVNHLGHFLLTNLLHDPLNAAEAGRVVVVASEAHKFVRKGVAFDDLQSEQKYGWMSAYGMSKLANLLFTRTLAARWKSDNITVNALHPGFVATRMGRDGDGGRLGDIVAVLGRPLAKSPAKAARVSLHLAIAPELTGSTGGYYVNTRPKQPAATALDDAAAERLWAISAELVGFE